MLVGFKCFTFAFSNIWSTWLNRQRKILIAFGIPIQKSVSTQAEYGKHYFSLCGASLLRWCLELVLYMWLAWLLLLHRIYQAGMKQSENCLMSPTWSGFMYTRWCRILFQGQWGVPLTVYPCHLAGVFGWDSWGIFSPNLYPRNIGLIFWGFPIGGTFFLYPRWDRGTSLPIPWLFHRIGRWFNCHDTWGCSPSSDQWLCQSDFDRMHQKLVKKMGKCTGQLRLVEVAQLKGWGHRNHWVQSIPI